MIDKNIILLGLTALIITSAFVFMVLGEGFSRKDLSVFDLYADQYNFNTQLESFYINPINKPANSDFALKIKLNEPADIYFLPTSECTTLKPLDDLDYIANFKNKKHVSFTTAQYSSLYSAQALCVLIYNKNKKQLDITLLVYPTNIVFKH